MATRRPLSRWLMLSLLLAAGVIGLLARYFSHGAPSALPAQERAVAVHSSTNVVSTSDSARMSAAGRSAAPESCREQWIDITIAGETARQCLGATQVIRNGSIRTFRLQGHGTRNAALRVDVAGKTVISAQLGEDGAAGFRCSAGGCAGITMGPYDTQGARTIVFDHAPLARPGVSAGAADEIASLNGRLTTLPDDQLPASTCTGRVLLISMAEGVVHFCPDSGSGFDMDDDGGRTYRFTNNDGDSLAVDMDKADRPRRIEYQGFACAAEACAGVLVSPAGAGGERDFSFRGTTLTDPLSGVVVLNGDVSVAPQ